MNNKHTHYYAFLLVCAIAFIAVSVSAQSSNLVELDGDTLVYTPFAVEGQSNAVNIIPDFSYAGYKGGGVAIPTVPVVQTLSPSGGDDTGAIQAAIDYAESLPVDGNGFRGAVLLQAGQYNIDQLFIEKSGVVLRGEGQGPDGTVLFAQLQTQHDVITIQGSGGGFDRTGSSRQDITSPYVALGSYSFDIADASGYAVGDTITIQRTPNQFWIDELGMDEATLCAGDPGCNGWTTNSYTIYHERVITAIAGNTVTVNIPIVDVMETQYGGGGIYKTSVPGRIEQCGVENLRIESYYDPNNPEDENHAWIAVRLKRTTNSWVKNVTGQYLGYGTVSITNESNFNTIQECASIDHVSQIAGARRYSFNIGDGLGNLIQRCYTREGRHDYVMGSRVTGPNVFLDNYSASTHSDIGPHQRWATGTLFDNIRGGQIRVQNRGSSGSGHGWAGNTTMFWNLLSYKQDIKVESPLGGINWGIGNTGLQQNGAGYWDNWNNPVLPRSLYLQQLEDRLGSQAVANVTIPEQLTGNIYSLLASWAGEGEFGQPTSTQAIFATADAYVRNSSTSNDNFGAVTELQIRETGAGQSRRSFLKFDLSSISGIVSEATFRVYVIDEPPSFNIQNEVHYVSDDSWSENTITWNNQPAIDTSVSLNDLPIFGEWLEVDVTALVNSVILDDGVLSLRLSGAPAASDFPPYDFASREYNATDRDPQIVYKTTGGALPVTLTRFTATAQRSANHLYWSTATELNNDRFEVQRSADARRWETLDWVSGMGTTQEPHDYRYVDKDPLPGLSYYRLKQIDYDGQYEYSPVASVRRGQAGLFEIFPNPAREQLQVRFVDTPPANARLHLRNVHGQAVQEWPVDMRDGLSLEGVRPGVYILQLESARGEVVHAERVVVQ
jgi:hypothetical protein